MLDLFMIAVLLLIALLMAGLMHWAGNTIEEGSDRR